MSVRFGWEHFIPGSHDRLMLTLSSKDLFINIALWFQCYLARHQDAGIYQITDLYLDRKHDVWDHLGEQRPLKCIYEIRGAGLFRL